MTFPEELQRRLAHENYCPEQSLSGLGCPSCGETLCGAFDLQMRECEHRVPVLADNDGENEEFKLLHGFTDSSCRNRRNCCSLIIKIGGVEYATCIFTSTNYSLYSSFLSAWTHSGPAIKCSSCHEAFRANKVLLPIPEPYIPEFMRFGCFALALKKRRSIRRDRRFHA